MHVAHAHISAHCITILPSIFIVIQCLHTDMRHNCSTSHMLHNPLDNEVYAWGNNSMGQCGQGNSTGPITKPKKVVGLDGVAIQQISAGTSHSLAWTALPRDRSVTSRVSTQSVVQFKH